MEHTLGARDSHPAPRARRLTRGLPSLTGTGDLHPLPVVAEHPEPKVPGCQVHGAQEPIRGAQSFRAPGGLGTATTDHVLGEGYKPGHEISSRARRNTRNPRSRIQRLGCSREWNAGRTRKSFLLIPLPPRTEALGSVTGTGRAPSPEGIPGTPPGCWCVPGGPCRAGGFPSTRTSTTVQGAHDGTEGDYSRIVSLTRRNTRNPRWVAFPPGRYGQYVDSRNAGQSRYP